MRILPYFFLLLSNALIVSCNQGTKKSEDLNLKRYRINFAEIELPVPDRCTSTSLYDFLFALDKADGLSEPDSNRHRLANIQFQGERYAIFADSLNAYNQIIVLEVPYFVMDAHSSGVMLSQMEKVLDANFSSKGVQRERLDNVLMQGNEAQIFKVRHLMHYPNQDQYSTMYLITSKKHTFMINARSVNDFDFDPLIHGISYFK